MNRRRFLTASAALGVGGAINLTSTSATAIVAGRASRFKILAPGSTGGGYDGMARSFERALTKARLIDGAQIVNLPGAGGTVGLAKFLADYNGREDAWLATGSTMVSAIIANRLPFDLNRATPLARLFKTFNAVVVPAASPIRTAGDLLATLRRNPEAVSWAGGSIGGGDHLLAGMVTQAAAVDPLRLNFVSFTGGGEILAALLGGHVAMASSGWFELSEQIRSGQIRCLGITAERPVPGIDAPTLRSQGIDVAFQSWGSVHGPSGLSVDQQDDMIKMVDRMVRHPAWAGELKMLGWLDAYLPGQAFAEYTTSQAASYRTILSSLGLI